MSSVSLSTAKSVYGGSNERETLLNLAAASRCRRIYKYANDFGDRRTHTDYKCITGDAQEAEFLNAPMVHNRVLVYDNGQVV